MNIAIYSRKSIETDKGESIKNQIEICKEYFSKRDSSCTFEIFEDEGYSGGNTNRPAFRDMINRAKRKEFEIIACYKIDRIARNVVDFVNIYSELEKKEVKLVSVTEGFDPSTPLGKLIMMILASFAEMERENIRQRVKDNMKELAKTGKWTGGNVPYGYTTERIKEGSKEATYLKLDNSKSDLIVEIFNYYVNCKSMHQVQKWLYSSKQIKWCMSTIKNILTSPIYVRANNDVISFLKAFGELFGEPNNTNGIITYNRRPYTNGKHRWNDKDLFYAVSRHEGIIDPKIWLLVQGMQEENKIKPRPKNSQVSYFTGLLRCSQCESPMTVNYNHKNKDGSINYVYVCTGRRNYGKEYCNSSQIKQMDLDNKIEEKLESYENDKNSFMKLFSSEDDKNTEKEMKKVNKAIKTNNIKIENLADKLTVLSNAAAKPIINKIEQITEENEQLKRTLIYMQQEIANKNIITPETKYENLKTFNKVLKHTQDINTKRELAEGIIEKITVDTSNMGAHIKFL